jgi:hypothetical protein
MSGFTDDVAIHGAVRGIDVEQVKRSDTVTGFVPQKRRWVVEQTHGTLMLHRRLVREYESKTGFVGVTDPVGVHGESGPPADRNDNAILARYVGSSPILPPQLDLIANREATASTTAEQLRERIAQLTDQLAVAETELAELAITRKTLTRPTGGDIQAPTPVDTPVDATIASPAAFATAPGGMRAKDLCLALGLDITPQHTEGTRAKLKRLVTRSILTEPEPGLFTLAPTPSA